MYLVSACNNNSLKGYVAKPPSCAKQTCILLSQVRIYNRVLSNELVQSLYL